MDEREAWRQQNAERLQQLEAEVLGQLGIDESDPAHQLRLLEFRQELETLERLSRLLEDEWGA